MTALSIAQELQRLRSAIEQGYEIAGHNGSYQGIAIAREKLDLLDEIKTILSKAEDLLPAVPDGWPMPADFPEHWYIDKIEGCAKHNEWWVTLKEDRVPWREVHGHDEFLGAPTISAGVATAVDRIRALCAAHPQRSPRDE